MEHFRYTFQNGQHRKARRTFEPAEDTIGRRMPVYQCHRALLKRRLDDVLVQPKA
jgi:hypothetical protein